MLLNVLPVNRRQDSLESTLVEIHEQIFLSSEFLKLLSLTLLSLSLLSFSTSPIHLQNFPKDRVSSSAARELKLQSNLIIKMVENFNTTKPQKNVLSNNE